MSKQEWRQALLTPPVYRLGNSSLRIQTHTVYILMMFGVFIFLVWYYLTSFSTNSSFFDSSNCADRYNINNCDKLCQHPVKGYNMTYPLSTPLKTGLDFMYKVGIVTDLDTESKSKTGKHSWISYFKTGFLTWSPLSNTVKVIWDSGDPVKLESSFGSGGRGMELSELVVFNGKLFSVDDRTGVVYEIEKGKAIPWVILTNGNGKTTKGLKAEWAAVKDQMLYVGGSGKEWTTPQGEYQNDDPQWVKAISINGEVSHLNWRNYYLKLRQILGIEFPGYMIHESAAWSDVHKKWFFLPRRASKESYHEDTDIYKGTNVMLTTDENFEKIEMIHIGELQPTRGFSSFKFIPGTNDDIIVALKSEETTEASATYIMAFTVKGNIILPETKFADLKYEGLEFI